MIGRHDIELVRRRYEHQRAAIVPRNVDLMPSPFAATMSDNADHRPHLSHEDRGWIVGHGGEPNAISRIWN